MRGGDWYDLRLGGIITQGLAGHPVLAIRAMEIAPQHAERQRVAARVKVEEWLFLDGIALEPSYIAEWHTQFAVLMEAHLADSASPFGDEASVPAGETAETVTLPVKEAPSNRMTVKNLCEPLGPGERPAQLRISSWIRPR